LKEKVEISLYEKGVCVESLGFIELGRGIKSAGQPFDFIFKQNELNNKGVLVCLCCATRVSKQVSKKKICQSNTLVC